jgi:hypothetical protein
MKHKILPQQLGEHSTTSKDPVAMIVAHFWS